MTIHAAKGLEFPVVFIVGVEEKIMPHIMAINESRGNPEAEKEAIEEERRICYVAMTRAEKLLFMSYCQNREFRNKYGGIDRRPVSPSRFLTESGLEIH